MNCLKVVFGEKIDESCFRPQFVIVGEKLAKNGSVLVLHNCTNYDFKNIEILKYLKLSIQL